MDLLDWRYAGHQKDIIQLSADLDRGWGHLEKKGRKPDYWGFDRQIYLPGKSEPEFWCHLYVVALGPITWESVRTFPGTVCRCELGYNSVSVNGSRMVVDIPLLNAWRPTNESGRERIFENEPLFSITTPDGVIRYRVQLWFVNLGPRHMLVKPEYEMGDGVALVGGRPESNPRKF
jgi:hypothetical protein